MKLEHKDLLQYLYIHINKIENQTWIGEIQNPFIGYREEFEGILEIITLVNNYLNEKNIAPPPVLYKSWNSDDKKIEKTFNHMLGSREKSNLITEEVAKLMKIKFENYEENLGSTDFLLKVCFRQHSSWQGELQWIGTEYRESKKIFFRSLLELILLIEEALEKEKRIKPTQKLHSWNEDSFKIQQKDLYKHKNEENGNKEEI